MTTTSEFRTAGPGDAEALTVLERDANLVALAHVFPPEQHAYPFADVRARWRTTLADPAVTVRVVEGAGRLEAYVAHDATTVRHLAVHPQRWGRGLARAAVDLAVASIRAGGAVPRLWVLEANHRARGLYEHLSWEPTGVRRASEWPPYPVELEYELRSPR